MKLISSTGFFNSGSSAITHMLSEFEGVTVPDNVYEVRLLYDPDGISDLEYNLVENPHRQNTSNAIYRFKKYVDFNSNPLMNHHYEKMFGGYFKKLSYIYINDISDFLFHGYSHIDKYNRGNLFWLVDRVYIRFIRTFCSKIETPSWVKRSLISDKTPQYAGTYDEEKFLNCTRKYIGSLLEKCERANGDCLMIDQLFPATNIERYIRYIPQNIDVKVFLVDRDPRDLFVTCKYFLKEKGIPCNTVEEFILWFKWTREQAKKFEYDGNRVKRVQFEDLIYDYENTRNKILDFVGLSDNEAPRKKQVFVPEKSINNTQVWQRYPDSLDEVRIIENKLIDYLYDFDKYSRKPEYGRGGAMFDC